MLQKKILHQYLTLNDSPTLREMSSATGIQMTRIFRLLSGSPMKLSEYEIFKSLIQKSQSGADLESLFLNCCLTLSKENMNEIEQLMLRKLEMNRLRKIDNKNINHQIA